MSSAPSNDRFTVISTAGLIRPEEAEQRLNIPLLVDILRRGRGTILMFALSGLTLGILLALLLPAKFTGTGSFIPPGSNVNGMSSMASRLSSLGGLGGGLLGGVKSSGDLYAGMLKSKTVADRLIQRFDLQHVYGLQKLSAAEKKLSGNTSIDVGVKDSIVTISVTDKSPKRAQQLANGYMEAIEQVSGSLAVTENSQRRLFYEQRLSQEKTALANAEVALKQTQESTGLIAPAGQAAVEIQALAQLRAQVTAYQVELAALRRSEADENPDIQRLRQQISSLQSQIAQMEKGRTGGPAGAPSTVQVPALELEYVRKLRDVKYHETLFDILAKQYEAARLDEAQDTPLQILDHANLPDSRSGPPRFLLTVGLLLLGVVAGVLTVVLREKVSNLLREVQAYGEANAGASNAAVNAGSEVAR